MGKSYMEKVAFEKGLWRLDWILIESLQGVIPGKGKDGQSMSVSSPQTFSEQCETSSAVGTEIPLTLASWSHKPTKVRFR